MKTLETQDDFEGNSAFFKEEEETPQRWIFWDWMVVIVFSLSIVANVVQYCENQRLKVQNESSQSIIKDLEILYRLK